MAKWIKATGDVVDVKPKNDGKPFTLEELRGFVDGFIECVFLNGKQVLVVNEEGKLRGLPYNAIATETLRIARQPSNDHIVGDAILCEIGTEIE